MIQVVAPCTMEEGFQFMATRNDGLTIPVTVPAGGVHEGQIFSVPATSQIDVGHTEMTPFFVNSAIREESERGHWKDGLFDCFRFGYFHPAVWNAMFCPQILMAQTLTRLELDWLGRPENDDEQRTNFSYDFAYNNHQQRQQRTFLRIVTLVSLYWVVTFFLSPPPAEWVQDYQTGRMTRLPALKSPPFKSFLYNSVGWGFACYTWIVLIRLRRTIRNRYAIPAANPCAEDVCVTFCCASCSIAQMARQTSDYGHQRAACCSVNGKGFESNYPSPSPSSSPSFVRTI